MQDRVVLLEFPDEAEAFVDRCRRLGLESSDPRVICLDAKAQVWLRNQGVPVVNTLPYFTSASHERALRKSHQLLEWLEPRMQVADRIDISAAYTNALLWYSRFIIHHLLYLSEILSEIHSQHPTATIQAATGHPDGNGSPFLQFSERYLGSLAEAYCGQEGVQFEPIDFAPPPRQVDPDSNARVRGLKWMARAIGGRLQRRVLKRMRRDRPLVSLTKIFRMDAIVRQARQGAPELPWVVMGEGARTMPKRELVRRSLQALNPRAESTNGCVYMGETWLRLLEWTVKVDRQFIRSLSVVLGGIAREIEDNQELFSHRGVPFGPHLASKIRTGIRSGIGLVHREVCAYDEFLDLLNPRLVIAPWGRRAQHALGELTQRRGIPSLLISHGSFTKTKNDLEEMGWNFHSYGLFHGSFTHAALQTPLAEEYSKGIESSAKFVRTGPLSWGANITRDSSGDLRSKLLPGREDCRVVVHAGTPKARSYMHFHVYETMDEYVAALTELIHAVEKVPDAYLLIKYRPTYLTVDELSALLPQSDSYCFSVDETFLEVLGITDLLVSFSSTTIEEALQNRVPVLLYGGDGRYQHVEAPLVTPGEEVAPGAVYAIAREEFLADGLKRILDCNGKAPLPEELFEPYVYGSGEYLEFPELVRELVKE